MNHFDETTILRHLDGELDPLRSAALVAHTEICAACRRLLQALQRETELLREALTEVDEPLPARFHAAPAAAEPSWALVVFAGMAVGGAYWLWSSLVAPWWGRLNSVGLGRSTLATTLLFRGIFWKGWSSMDERLFETLGVATLTLGVVTVALVMRWAWRYSQTRAVLLGALVTAGLLQDPVQAAEIKKGRETYTLRAGEVVHNDLIVAARTTRIEGTIEGDLIAVSQAVTVSGRVTGDVIALAQTVRVAGAVEGNVRSLSQFLEIPGQVHRNVTTVCEDAQLESDGKIQGGLTVFAETAKIDGQVSRDLMVFAERQEIRGAVRGNALLGGAELEILPGATIVGSAEFHGGREPVVSPEAKLARPLEVRLNVSRSRYTRPGYYWEQALGWAAAFLFGFVLVMLLPGFFTDVVQAVRRTGPALGFGALATVGLPIVAALVAITVVGLSVGLTAFFLYLVALYSAQVYVAAWLGEKFIGEARVPGEWLKRLALGLAAIRVAGMVPVAGVVVRLAVTLLGTGALVLALYQRLRLERAPV